MTTSPDRVPELARRVWTRLEAVHVLAYFAPSVVAAHAALGIEDRMTSYVAGRSAPMGAVGPELVTSAFYGFAPRMIARALPSAWDLAPPEVVLTATQTAMAELVAELAGDEPTLTEAAALAVEAAELHPTLGRPLAAAWSGVPWSEDPALALWQAATRIRESRGDGHLALLVAQPLDGVEAHLTVRGDNEKVRNILGLLRGITAEEWDAAADRLRDRGLLDTTGALTDAGAAVRDRLEARTDELASPPWVTLGVDRTTALLAALEPIVARVLAAGIVPGVVARAATA